MDPLEKTNVRKSSYKQRDASVTPVVAIIQNLKVHWTSANLPQDNNWRGAI